VGRVWKGELVKGRERGKGDKGCQEAGWVEIDRLQQGL